MRRGGLHHELQREQDQAQADARRGRVCPARVVRSERKNTTPKKISSGEIQRQVEREARSAMSAGADVRAQHDRERRPERDQALRRRTSSRSARWRSSDWTSAGDAEAREEGATSGWRRSSRGRGAGPRRRRAGCRCARCACPRRAGRRSRGRLRQCLQPASSTLPGRLKVFRLREALHRFLHAFLVAEARVLDAAEGRELEAVAGHLAHVDACPPAARPRSG